MEGSHMEGNGARPEAGQPLDRATERVVSELAARILPPLARAIEAHAATSPSPEEIASALRPELDRLERAIVQAQEERDRALLHPMAAAMEEIASLRVLCGDLSRSIEGLHMMGGGKALDGLREVVGQVREALGDVPAMRRDVLAALSSLDGASASLKEDARALAEGERARLERIEGIVKGGLDEGRAERRALSLSLGPIAEELVALRRALDDGLEALRGASEQAGRDVSAKLIERSDSIERTLAGWGDLGQDALEALIALSAEVSSLKEGKGGEGDAAALARSSSDASLAQLMDVSIPAWEGILRAHGQAQTRELEALSREMSDLHEQSRAAMLQAVQDALRHEGIEHGPARSGGADAWRASMEQQLRRMSLALWLLATIGGISIFLLILSAFR